MSDVTVTNTNTSTASNNTSTANTLKSSGAPSTSSSAQSTQSAAPKPKTSREFLKHLYSPERGAELEALADVGESADGDSLANVQLSNAEQEAADSSATEGDVEQVQTTEPQPGDDDFSWAQELAEFRDGLHGVALKDLLTALRDGSLPDALLDKLQLDLQDGDQTWRASISDAKNGAMMRAKFSKLTQEHAAQVKAWEAERAEFVDYVKGWKENPELLLAGMERLGLPFDQAARMYADRLKKIDHLWQLEQQGHVPPGTTKELWEQQNRERELTELKRQQQAYEQKQRQQQTEKQADEAGKVIEQASAQALRSVGLDPSETATWNIFKRHLNEIYAQKQALPTRQDILEAAALAKEERELYIQQYNQRQQKTQQAQPAVPRNADAGAPNMATARGPRNAPAKPITTKDWVRRNLYSFGKSR